MIEQIGLVIERITQAVRNFGISPHSPVVVRVGDFGVEMPIEHIKVQGGIEPKLVIQVRAPQ